MRVPHKNRLKFQNTIGAMIATRRLRYLVIRSGLMRTTPLPSPLPASPRLFDSPRRKPIEGQEAPETSSLSQATKIRKTCGDSASSSYFGSAYQARTAESTPKQEELPRFSTPPPGRIILGNLSMEVSPSNSIQRGSRPRSACPMPTKTSLQAPTRAP